MADNSLWQLAIRAQEKDIVAIEEIYKRTVVDNYILIKTVLGKDCEVSDVLSQAYTDIFSNIVYLDNPKDCKEYLNEITAKTLSKYLSDKKNVQFSAPSGNVAADLSLDTEKANFNTFVVPYSIEADDIFEEIVAILNQFPSSQRFFMLLYFFFDMDISSISSVTEVSSEVVQSNITDMVSKLCTSVARLEEDIPELKEVNATPFIVWAIKGGTSELSKSFDFSEIYKHVSEEFKNDNFFETLVDSDISIVEPSASNELNDKNIPNEELKDMGVVAEKVPFSQKSRLTKFFIIVAASIPVLCVLFYVGLIVRSYINISRNHIEPTRIYTVDHNSERDTESKTIVVTKPKKVTTTTTTVPPVTLTKIVIGSPTNTSYKVGQALKFTLVGQYSNGSVKPITSGYSVIGNTSTAGRQTIIVTYKGLSTSFTISVQRAVSKIEIAARATKVNYYVGDLLDTSGLKLKITYNDKTTEVITSGFTCSPTVLNTVGKQKITISYSSLSVSYNVAVNRKPGTATTSSPTTANEPTTEPPTNPPTNPPETTTNPPETTTKHTVEITVTTTKRRLLF